MHSVPIKDKKKNSTRFSIGAGHPLAIMCGPCVIESEEHCLRAAETLKKIFTTHDIHLIFKSSYDKANRSSIHSYRGVGLDEGLRILERVQREFDLPVVTDVHSPEEATAAGSVCDLVQIPAFLCRQTDLIVAAARSGAVVNVKKGQFMAPADMGNVVEKIHEAGNKNVILVERGTSFGYNNLVVDPRSFAIMKDFNVPVCFDATHAVQLPGGLGKTSGGERRFIPTLANAALAAGANCLFIEAHPDPAKAMSDAATVLPFEDLPKLLPIFKRLYDVVNS
ncbi:MAG: 3-deoxy-8-phosphooctulonate synthase [Parachlamydiaceae bacterium]|nr:3-deoxy-8-phosphooctulonate synthase [Parachlamydiaceae bacterium]